MSCSNIEVELIGYESVPWSELESDLQKALNTKAKFGAKKCCFVGTKMGWYAQIYRIHFDWEDEADSILPSEACLKITDPKKFEEHAQRVRPDAQSRQDFFETTAKLHDAECAFYTSVSSGVWEWSGEEFRVPKLYCSRPFQENVPGYLLMEHVEGELRGIQHVIPFEAVCDVLRIIAKMHALSWQSKEIKLCFTSDQVEQNVDLENLVERLEEFVSENECVREDWKIVKEFLIQFPKTVEEHQKKISEIENELPTVFIHGDLSPANIIWEFDTSGLLSPKSIIDWQRCRLGSPLIDLTDLLTTCLSAEERLCKTEVCLNVYYLEFSAVLQESNIKPPFSLEQTMVSANYIGESAITWELLESDLRKSLKTAAVFGPTMSAKPLGIGMGLISNLYVVSFDWTSSVDGENLPDKACLKITDSTRLEELCEKMNTVESSHDELAQSVHDNELAFYESISNGLWGLTAEDLRVPTIYCGRKFGECESRAGYLLIEFFDNSLPLGMHHSIDTNGVLEVAEMLARIHSNCWKSPELKDYFNVERKREDYRKLEELPAELLNFAEKYNVSKEHVEIINERLLKKLAATNSQHENCMRQLESEFCTTLIHGDVWPPNIIWRKDSKHCNGVMPSAIIDWQGCILGNPLQDICDLVTTCVPSAHRADVTTLVLNRYHEKFVEQLDNSEIPPLTITKLTEYFERFYGLYMLPFVPQFNVIWKDFSGSISKSEISNAEVVFFDKCKGIIEQSAVYVQKWY